MEAYLMSWRRFAKMNDTKHQIFSPINSNDFKMTNSLRTKDDIKEKVESNESDTNSLPIHCIVQAISSIEDLKTTSCRSCHGRSINSENWWECNCKSTDMSGCVVVPENTSMNDLVETVLLKLGYPNCASSFAAGSILIRNWEPLPLETVCPEMKKTVGDILGELTAVISLRIQIFRPKITTLQKIKDSLLNFLIRSNEKFLRESDCPFDTYTLSEFCDQSNSTKKPMVQEPSEDLRGKFEAWLKFQEKTRSDLENGISETQSTSFLPNNNSISDKNICNGNSHDVNGNSRMVISIPQRPESVRSETCGKPMEDCTKKENEDSVKEPTSLSVIEGPKALAPIKTRVRVRTSFDPEFELPKLHKWYLENPHPSKQQIYEYVAELNSLKTRKGRKPLDINNVVYWFKNARAAQRRTECRRFLSPPSSGMNRYKVHKMPLGKSSELPSEDLKIVSDDEASVTSGSGDDYRNSNGNGNGRCLQVVGKWNSNGQGEAVLEMQIAARKNEFVQSIVDTKKDETNDNEETSKSAILSGDDDSVDQVVKTPVVKEENSPRETPERNIQQKGNQRVGSKEMNKMETGESDMTENGERRSGGDVKDKEVSSSKVSIRNTFLYKENASINNGAFLPPYKSGFAVPSNSILGHSFICMSQYINRKPNSLPLSSDERRKRNRTFIDPVTEVPRLEQWFRLSTHPSHSLIVRYTEELNNMPYRKKFPKLETKNVQFWFKNRRAKNKRLNYLEANN